MKKILILCYTALLVAFIVPLFLQTPAAPRAKEPLTLPQIRRARALRDRVQRGGADREQTQGGQASGVQTPEDAPTGETPQETQARGELWGTVRVLHGGQLYPMAAGDYLTGVVAAEMPASFEEEALRAQAVAARSYAVYCALSEKHGEAQVCTDAGCCQAWLSEEERRERWGTDFAVYEKKLREAVSSTAAERLLYEGQPVLAAFHSSSAGATEASGEIWNSLPYLVSVPSPEGEGDVPGYVSSVDVSTLDFRDSILYLCPQADFSTPPEQWLGEVRRDESGRVETVLLGGQEIRATSLRQIFSLRSTAFTLEYTGEGFRFTVTGYGHGVGMSQYGANVMAGKGMNYREILAHYYPGTELVRA